MPRPLPRMQEYLDSLPQGLDSYPTYQSKALIFSADHQRELIAHVDSFPPAIAELIRNPLPATQWVPEVYMTACHIGIADLRGLDEDQFEKASFQDNRTIMASPLYRVLMFIASPRRLFGSSEKRWSAFHRGVELGCELGEPDDNRVRITLRYPSRLVPRITARGYCGAFHAALEAAGGKEGRFEIVEHTPIRAKFEGRWK
jgi:hypothetical protein